MSIVPSVGLSLMPQADFWAASQPLLSAGIVDVLEWSFDLGWGNVSLPSWVSTTVASYSQRDRLLGHGVSYSLLSAYGEAEGTVAAHHNYWLRCLAAECDQYQYRHISEHFGWMRTENFQRSAPLPLPLSPETLAMGRDRLQRLAEAAQVPVGLENLAFAFGQADVWEQGTFLDQLLEPVDGFLLLDLHNLYCQSHNFHIQAETLLQHYPLKRVREIHLSGGSWSHHPSGSIRRDTHDQAVPEAVFELLAIALHHCPQVEFVILERLGNTLTAAAEQLQFQQDFQRICQLVQRERGDSHD
jgi:uncharacterized protein